MTAVQELEAGYATIFGARNSGGDEYFGVFPGKMTDEEIFALDPDFWGCEEAAADDLDVDYALYVNHAAKLQPGDYTVSFTSSESGDRFFDLIEGHVSDPRVLRAYAMAEMEEWWGYEGKISDPNLGVDEYDDGPNLEEAFFLKVL